jgi:hypothetical protein
MSQVLLPDGNAHWEKSSPFLKEPQSRRFPVRSNSKDSQDSKDSPGVGSNYGFPTMMDPATLLKLHSAVRWGKPVAELRELGLTDSTVAEQQDKKNGNTSLHVAAQNGHYDLVCFLVRDLNCYTDIQNKVGNTALHMGVEYDYYTINKLLVDAGADTGIANADGSPAIAGISGSKVGLSAWNNPVTMLKTVQDNTESLEEVFLALDTCAKGDVKKEELVRIIMTKTKKLCAWKDGNFQTRFMRIAAKL